MDVLKRGLETIGVLALLLAIVHAQYGEHSICLNLFKHNDGEIPQSYQYITGYLKDIEPTPGIYICT